jgi:hypothetical protein
MTIDFRPFRGPHLEEHGCYHKLSKSFVPQSLQRFAAKGVNAANDPHDGDPLFFGLS